MLFSLTSKQAPDRRVNLRPPRSRTIGLALGAGSARGWAHIGVIRELADHGIMPDVVAGTSIGAVIGGAYAAGKLDALEIFARGLNRRRVFTLMDLSLGGSGLMAGGRLKRRLNRDLSGLDIERLAIPFAAVAAEMTTGNEIWMTKGNLVEAVRASYALPGIFEPVLVDGRWLFDGALVNPVPVSVCRSLGADIVIGVNLIADIGARMPPGARAASRPTRSAAAHAFVTDDLADQDFADQDVTDQHLAAESAPSARLPLRKRGRLFSSRRMFLRRENGAPGIASVMMDAFSISQDRISRSRLAIDPADIMISARSTTCGLFDFHKAAELIEYGRTATRGALPAIEAILAETRSVPN